MIQYFQLLMQIYSYYKSFAWLYWRRSFCFGTQRARLHICRCEGIWPKGYTNDGVSDDYKKERKGINNQREACLGNPNSEKDRGCGEGCTWNEVLKWYQFQTGKIIPGFQHLGWDVTEARLGLGTQIGGRNNIHDNKKSLWVRSGHMEESQTWKSTVGDKMACHHQKWVSNREGGFEALLLGLTGWGILNIELREVRGEHFDHRSWLDLTPAEWPAMTTLQQDSGPSKLPGSRADPIKKFLQPTSLCSRAPPRNKYIPQSLSLSLSVFCFWSWFPYLGPYFFNTWDKCSGLVHWKDPEGSSREGGGRGDRDGEYM